MVSVEDRGFSSETSKLKLQIDQWRETRIRRGPMPAPLWAASVGLAKRYGLHRVSTALGIKYEGLKRQSESGSDRLRKYSRSQVSSPTGFVEVDTVLSAMSGNAGTVLEWSRGDGSRLTIRIHGSREHETTELARTLIQLVR